MPGARSKQGSRLPELDLPIPDLRADGLWPDFPRREFLRSGALLGLGVGISGLAACSAEAPGVDLSRVGPPRRVTLGSTGIQVPDIGFGTFALEDDEALVRHALDRGITHFDTAEGYAEGRAEETLGRALAGEWGRVTVTTKTVAEADAPADVLMARLEASLHRLGTDRVDFYLNHAVDAPARMSNPGWSEFVERAKEQGKIRFSGMSGHGPSLVRCLDAALAAGQLDVILVAYNYAQSPDFFDAAKWWVQRKLGRFDWVAQQPELPNFLERARAAGVGVMTMKTLHGARLNDMRPYEHGGATFAQAALRWVLADPRVDSAVITMTTAALVDEYLGASGGASPTREDLALLCNYETLNRGRVCLQGCSACLGSCPDEVPISEVLRIGMYDRDYGQPAIAQRAYRTLARDADACQSCSGAPCESACPSGVSIRALARSAHQRLVG